MVAFLTARTGSAVAKNATIEVAVEGVEHNASQETILLFEELRPTILQLIAVVINQAVKR